MDPVTASLALTAGQAVAGGIAGRQEAKGEQQRAEINSFIGRTRAIQTSADNLKDLNEESGTMRAVFGANGQTPGVGTLEVVRELRRTRDRERRINVGNENRRADDFQIQANNAESRANSSLFRGAIKAGPSLFDIYDYNRSR